MLERKAMDMPAMTILVVLGIVFIGASAPFLPALYCKSPSHNADLCEAAPAGAAPSTFDVTWFQSPASAKTVHLTGAAPAPQSTNITVTGLPANVTLAASSCTDTARAPIQQPATVSLILTDTAKVQVAKYTFTCADATKAWTVQPASNLAPDIATVSAVNEREAIQSVWGNAKVSNRTADYTLTVSVSRPGPLPSPRPLPTDATIDVNVAFGVSLWDVRVTPQPNTGVGK